MKTSLIFILVTVDVGFSNHQVVLHSCTIFTWKDVKVPTFAVLAIISILPVYCSLI